MTPTLPIRQWVEQTFAGPEEKLFLELGAHCGKDTAWMQSLPNCLVLAFEPDPRNAVPEKPNVTRIHQAVSDHDGTAPMFLSEFGWGRPWTFSSSLKRPKRHLNRYPVTFEKTITVKTVKLDTICSAMEQIDLIWCDIQGSEGDMIQGATKTLKRTRYLYTEYSNEELYEGQPTLHDLLLMLSGFQIVSLWPRDVLLANTQIEKRKAAA